MYESCTNGCWITMVEPPSQWAPIVSMRILFHLDFTESMYNWAIPVVHWEVTKL